MRDSPNYGYPQLYARKAPRWTSLLIDSGVHKSRFARAGRFFRKPRDSKRGTVMTIKLEVVDLGDAMVETRQLPILPLFIDSISSFGLLPL